VKPTLALALMEAAEDALRDEGATEGEVGMLVGYQDGMTLAKDMAMLGGPEKWASHQLSRLRASSADTTSRMT